MVLTPHALRAASLALLLGAPGCSWFEADERAGPSDAAPPEESGRLAVSALAAGDELGTAVAATPDLIAVGAPGDDRLASESGAVHFFMPGADGWNEAGVLLADGGRAGDRFGSALALAGDLLAVGAPGRDEDGSYAGAVYVYRRSGGLWEQAAMLLAPDDHPGDRFGTAVGFVDPDRLAIGASGHDGEQPGAGATYLFQSQGD